MDNEKGNLTFFLEQLTDENNGIIPDIFYTSKIDYSEKIRKKVQYKNSATIEINETAGINIVRTADSKYYKPLIYTIYHNQYETEDKGRLLWSLLKNNDIESLTSLLNTLADKIKKNVTSKFSTNTIHEVQKFLQTILDISNVVYTLKSCKKTQILSKYHTLFLACVELADSYHEAMYKVKRTNKWSSCWFLEKESIQSISVCYTGFNKKPWEPLFAQHDFLFPLFKSAYEQSIAEKENPLLKEELLKIAIESNNSKVVNFYEVKNLFPESKIVEYLNTVLNEKLIEAYKQQKQFNLSFIKHMLSKYNAITNKNKGIFIANSFLSETKPGINYEQSSILQTELITQNGKVFFGDLIRSGVCFDLFIQNQSIKKKDTDKICPLYMIYKKITDNIPDITQDTSLKNYKNNCFFEGAPIQPLIYPYNMLIGRNYEDQIKTFLSHIELKESLDKNTEDNPSRTIKHKI